MGHYKLMFEDEFLGAHDLLNRDVTVTIARVQIETLERDDGKEDRPVMHFKEMQSRDPKKRKRWILGKFVARCIAMLHGTDADAWRDKQITIFPARCEAFGEMTDCIRVRVPGYTLTKSGNKLRRLKRGEADPTAMRTKQREPKNPPPETERQPGDDEHDPRDKDAP